MSDKKALERALAWQKANPERRKEIRAKWIENNKEKMQLIRLAWKKENPEKVRASKAATQSTRRAKKSMAGGSFNPMQINKLHALQKGCCAICRHVLGNDFERDHITPIALGGSSDIKNIQLLCRPCNRQKGANDPIEHANKLGLLL